MKKSAHFIFLTLSFFFCPLMLEAQSPFFKDFEFEEIRNIVCFEKLSSLSLDVDIPASCSSQPSLSRKVIDFTSTTTSIILRFNNIKVQSSHLVISILSVENNNILTPLKCEDRNTGVNLEEWYFHELNPFKKYLLVIEGIEKWSEVCLERVNFRKPAFFCDEARILCDKSEIYVPNIATNNPNNDLEESCYGSDDEDIVHWYQWTCDESGLLNFTISPNEFFTDYDFVLFEVGDDATSNCSDKQEIRCMLAGRDIGKRWREKCIGPTGLQVGESDTFEESGCLRRNNNFLAPLDMKKGKTYLLAVVNFEKSNIGYTLEFNGSGTFVGPRTTLVSEPEMPICDEEISLFRETISPYGPVVNENWFFGEGASLQSDVSSNPIKLQYENFGTKRIYLEVETADGCITQIEDSLTIESCCQSNDLSATWQLYDEPTCFEYTDGALSVLGQGGSNVYGYRYTLNNLDQQRSGQFNDLGTGDYNISIFDDKGCELILDTFLSEPEPFIIEANINRDSIELGEEATVDLSYYPDSNTITKILLQGEERDCFTTDCLTFIDTPFVNGSYLIQAVSLPGCLAEVDIPITIKNIRTIVFPNVLKVSATNTNQYFTLFSKRLTKGMDLQVYDRWGSLLFDQKDIPLNEPELGWNGLHNSQRLPAGTYIFKANVYFVDGSSKWYVGDILLLY